MNIKIEPPKLCSAFELNEFRKLVLLGGQVKEKGLERRILNCKYLGLCFVNNELVGISAIKQPTISKTTRVLKRAEIDDREPLIYELGYSVTKTNFRGRHINSTINDMLLSSINSDIGIYATTDNEKMRNYLTLRGFNKFGKTFKGEFNLNLDYYEREKK